LSELSFSPARYSVKGLASSFSALLTHTLKATFRLSSPEANLLMAGDMQGIFLPHVLGNHTCKLGVKRLGEILVPLGIRLCEPMLIKAHVAAWPLLTNAISEAEEILPEGTKIEYNNKEGLRLSTTTNPETPALRKSSLTRNAAKELIGQYCLEGIVAAGTEEAAKLTSVPDEKPDPTWTIRFLGYAEGMADPYLQELWGKVLAGEIEQPGSYSLRTLDVLSAMTQKEAERFVGACQYLIWTPHYQCISRDVTFLRGWCETSRNLPKESFKRPCSR
jgi:hypothetical protein